VSSIEEQAELRKPSDQPVISADGRFVAFRSFATNLVSGDTNNAVDIFVRDLVETTDSYERDLILFPKCTSQVGPATLNMEGELKERERGRSIEFSCSKSRTSFDTTTVETLSGTLFLP
jgi:hypothetical protein